MADWLNTVFHSFDIGILTAIHRFFLATGGVLTPLVEVLTAPGNGGLGFILLGLLLLLFPKTRKTGCLVLFSLLVGALFTNLTLKPLVARPRPYTTAPLCDWWVAVGAGAESDLSFPSGHTTSATAAMLAVFLCNNKKRSWAVLIYPLVMGFTRLYLVVHYPTDVLAGLLCGAISALIAYFATRPLFAYIDAHGELRWCRALRTADPVGRLIGRIRHGKQSPPPDDPNENP